MIIRARCKEGKRKHFNTNLSSRLIFIRFQNSEITKG